MHYLRLIQLIQIKIITALFQEIIAHQPQTNLHIGALNLANANAFHNFVALKNSGIQAAANVLAFK